MLSIKRARLRIAAVKVLAFAGGDGSRFALEAKRLFKMSIGPHFVAVAAWKCEDVGFLVMEKWDGTLRPSDKLSKKALIGKLEDQVGKLKGMGLVHGDILHKNILVRRDSSGNVKDVTSMATKEAWQADIPFLTTMYLYHTT